MEPAPAPAAQHEEADALRRDLDRLKADLYRLKSDFSGLADDAAQAARSGAAEARNRVERKADAAAAKGRESVEAIEEQIAAHPLMSLATAFAVGMVVGLGLSRKD